MGINHDRIERQCFADVLCVRGIRILEHRQPTPREETAGIRPQRMVKAD